MISNCCVWLPLCVFFLLNTFWLLSACLSSSLNADWFSNYHRSASCLSLYSCCLLVC
jgi:hypothetical protein